MSTKFVREGMESDKINDTFYLTDWLTVLHVYKKLKEEEGELPSLIPRNDFSEIPVEVAEELDDVIHGILKQFEEADTSNNDPVVAMLSGEVNMYGFIMHDPLIKKAIGNVAIEIFMRDQKVSEEEAYEKAKEMLPDFMGDFEQFIGSVATLALKQITSKAGKHGIHVTDVRERLTPKVSEIGAFGIKLHFAQPDSSSAKRDYSDKKDSDLDTMYG
tara:strand:+ start:843 stop:1490 length:648 start_codon:yes stop_codon:yes gene_type:complete